MKSGARIVRIHVVGMQNAATWARIGHGTTGQELAETRQDLMT
jgi:hypothetical protein